MNKHLWEVKHSYYCNLGNYYANGCGHQYDSFDDFLEEWGDADMDYNLLFRWDWKEYEPDDWTDEEVEDDDHYSGDKLEVFWMLQRKGAYRFCEIKVNKEDEQKVIEFLKPRWEYMKSLWQPFDEEVK
jgi:hypothetical protein